MKQAILVIGMHRSGTSVLTRIINLLGADITSDLMSPAKDNESGFWESLELEKIHSDILESYKSSWDDIFPIEMDFDSQLFKDNTDIIINYLTNNFMDSNLFVIKDPRICRLLPIWIKAFESLNIKLNIINIFRNPIAVANSLKKRNNFLYSKSFIIWVRHVIESESYSRDLNRCFVSYENLMHDYKKVITDISVKCDIKWPNYGRTALLEIEKFIQPKLQHNHAELSELNQPHFSIWLKEVYVILQEYLKEPKSSHLENQIDMLNNIINQSDLLYGDIVTDCYSTINLRKESEKELLERNDHLNIQLDSNKILLNENQEQYKIIINELAEKKQIIKALECENKQLEEKFNSVHVCQNENIEKIKQLEKIVDTQNQDIQYSIKNIDQLEEQIINNKAEDTEKIKQLESIISEQVKEIQCLNKKNRQLVNEKQNYEHLQIDCLGKINSLELILNEKQKNLKKFENQILHSLERLKTTKAMVEEKNKRIEQLKSQVIDAKEQINQINQLLNSKSEKVDGAETRLKVKSIQCENLITELSKLKYQNSQIKDKYNCAEKLSSFYKLFSKHLTIEFTKLYSSSTGNYENLRSYESLKNIQNKFERITPEFLILFDQVRYLERNSDVREAVKNNAYESALEHLVLSGYDEVLSKKRKLYDSSSSYIPLSDILSLTKNDV